MAAEPTLQTWWLEPRDPLVLRDGGRGVALQPHAVPRLPPQATVAGLVRTSWLEALGTTSAQAAETSLGVSIRGPWLVRRTAGALQPWLPVPADVVVVDGALQCAELVRPDPEEGTLWPDEVELALDLLALPQRDGRKRKTHRPAFAFWPLEAVIAWGLGQAPQNSGVEKAPYPIEPEARVHVSIDEETMTAKREALFSSAGLRFAEGFELAVEVSAPGEPPPPSLRFLGGEARTVRYRAEAEPLLPAYEAVSARFEARVEEITARGGVLGLRLQLITPGSFGGWQPAWPPALAGRLRAVAMERHLSVSGWNLQQARQRPVRRLVPAGSVYLFGHFSDAAEVLALCRAHWCRALPATALQGDDEFRATPEADGYGIALAFPYALPKEVS